MIQIAFKSLLAALLFLPAVTLLARRSKSGRRVSSLLLLAAMIVGTAVGASCWLYGKEAALDLSSLAPLSFALTIDRLSAFFLLLICAVGVPVVLFSISYIERHYEGPSRIWLWVLLPWFLLSMVVVVTASTAFAFLFGWELMTLASAGLILTDGDSEERRHNLFVYLLMMHAGAAAVIAAFMLFVPVVPSLGFAGMRAAAATMSPAMRTWIFLLAFVGFGTKAGIIPLHLWLPKAHPIAPSPVSALMSGVMLKTAVYGFVRFSFDFLGTGPSWWGYLVLAAGAVSGVLGVLYAIAEHDLKRLLAYHSVENIGIIYMALGASLIFVSQGEGTFAAVALCAALLHCLNHALFKSLLFLGAGAVSDATHTLDIEEMGGLLRRMPATGAALLIACCSIVGLPLFNGFVSEWLAFRSFLAGAALGSMTASIVLPLSIGVLGLIGGLAAACFAKVYGVAFLGRARSQEAEHAHEVPTAMRAGMITLAAACVAIGLFPGLLVRPLATNVQELVRGGALPVEISRFTQLMPWIGVGVVAICFVYLLVRRVKRVTATWACGLPGLDERMQYTSTAFSKPLRAVFASVYRAERTVEILPAVQPYFPKSITYRSVRTTSFERSLYRPGVEAIVAVGRRLRTLQTGNIQVYLLYLFLALIGVLLFMRFA